MNTDCSKSAYGSWRLQIKCWKGVSGEGKTFTYLGEMFDSSAIFLDVFSAGIAEEQCRTGSFVCTEACILNLLSKVTERLQRTWPVRKASTLGKPLKKGEMKQCH